MKTISNYTYSSLLAGDGAAQGGARLQSYGRAADHPRSIG